MCVNNKPTQFEHWHNWRQYSSGIFFTFFCCTKLKSLPTFADTAKNNKNLSICIFIALKILHYIYVNSHLIVTFAAWLDGFKIFFSKKPNRNEILIVGLGKYWLQNTKIHRAQYRLFDVVDETIPNRWHLEIDTHGIAEFWFKGKNVLWSLPPALNLTAKAVALDDKVEDRQRKFAGHRDDLHLDLGATRPR